MIMPPLVNLREFLKENKSRNTMKNFKIAMISAAFGLSTGCASILTEDTTKINVLTSNGNQAVIAIDETEHTVPGIVEVKKDGEDKIITVKEGDCAKETLLRKDIEPTFWVNILTGGTFGSTTDMQTNKMWTYQDSITVNCK